MIYFVYIYTATLVFIFFPASLCESKKDAVYLCKQLRMLVERAHRHVLSRRARETFSENYVQLCIRNPGLLIII